MFNLHPYQQAYDKTDDNYMSLDMDTLNPYSYKNLTDNLIPYQKQEDMYYFYKTIKSHIIRNIIPTNDGPI
jgi:hypothetical protein